MLLCQLGDAGAAAGSEHISRRAAKGEARPQTFVELGTDPGVEFVPSDGTSISLAARDPRLELHGRRCTASSAGRCSPASYPNYA